MLQARRLPAYWRKGFIASVEDLAEMSRRLEELSAKKVGGRGGLWGRGGWKLCAPAWGHICLAGGCLNQAAMC